MADVKITARKNGPYRVEGEIDLYYEDRKVDTPPPPFSLCRCGASSKKPFCDGTHSKIGFDGAMKAVEKAEGQS